MQYFEWVADLMRIPLKSHSKSGACRTVGERKHWPNIFYIKCAAWSGIPAICVGILQPK